MRVVLLRVVLCEGSNVSKSRCMSVVWCVVLSRSCEDLEHGILKYLQVQMKQP